MVHVRSGCSSGEHLVDELSMLLLVVVVAHGLRAPICKYIQLCRYLGQAIKFIYTILVNVLYTLEAYFPPSFAVLHIAIIADECMQ